MPVDAKTGKIYRLSQKMTVYQHSVCLKLMKNKLILSDGIILRWKQKKKMIFDVSCCLKNQNMEKNEEKWQISGTIMPELTVH